MPDTLRRKRVPAATRPKIIDPARSCRRLTVATAVVAVLAAGCGGSSGPATGTKPTSVTRTAESTRRSAPRHAQTGPSALNFAKCMRAHGVPNFPDPNSEGSFQLSAGLSPGAPAVAAAQAKCQRFMPGGGPLSPGPPASAQTMALLRRVAVCMRAHGVPQFPDPLASVPPGFKLTPGRYREITNYMGAILLYPTTIDPQSPAYQQATAACHAGFLAGNNAH